MIATGLVSPDDGPITINADNSLGGDFAKPPVSPTEDDLAKAENFIDSAYMEVILDANKSSYSNLVKDIEADHDSQLTQLSLLLKKVSNELSDLKASHAALLAANNEITNELTALRNDVTSHLQTQSQRLPETNDLKDSHAALLVATNEIANEVINLRNDITSHFHKQSHILSDSQGWTSVGKNRRPIDIQNKFKALEVSDGEISPKASDAKPDENSPLIINADRSTPMTSPSDKDITKTLQVYTVTRPCCSAKTISKESVGQYSHLKNVSDKIHLSGGAIDLLIGTDFVEAFIDIHTASGEPGVPIGKRNCFGWYVLGQFKSNGSTLSEIQSIEVGTVSVEEDIKKLLHQYLLGVKPTKLCTCTENMLREVPRSFNYLGRRENTIEDALEKKRASKTCLQIFCLGILLNTSSLLQNR